MIILTLVLIAGVSYALWQVVLQQTTENVITTGCFKIEYSDVNPINLQSAYPISDEEGKILIPYEFTITNTCNSFASFQINLEILNTTTLENLGFLKVMLDDKTNLLTSNDVVTKTLDNAKTSYKLESGYLRENQSKTFTLRLWMNEDTPTREEFMNKLFESKVTVIASYIIDEVPPEIIASTSKNELNSITVDASDSFDEDSGIETYFFRLEEESWNESTEPVYTFSNLEYQEYTIEIQAEDFLGNKSEIKSLKEFPKVKATDYVNSLNGNGEVLNDGTIDNNVRYIGSNPNNYVLFNDELWRIIGSMNNINDGTGKKETRIKLIRNESIGEFSWDTSASSINAGYGINEWSQSDAMKLMNPGYSGIGGSLYWNRGSGSCYNGASNSITACNFNTSGLKDTAKSMISQAVWYTGSNGSEVAYDNIKTQKFYQLERSRNTGKICSCGEFCDDTVRRTTTWVGNVGLLSPSDYGFASGSTVRATCLNTVLWNWSSTVCANYNWLHKSELDQWTITSIAYSSSSADVFYLNGDVLGDSAFYDRAVFPVVFLKSNVNIISGTGEWNSPYALSLD